jgi:plasmid maintenance system antidote protein VapI
VYGVAHAPQADQAAPTTQDIVAKLKSKGMPISGLSEVLHVERKTIYSWLDDGVEANDSNYQRLRDVFSVFEAEEDGSLRFFHRLWQRKLPDGSTLKDQLTAVHLNKEALARALDVLRPAVSRAMKVDTQRKIGSTVPHAAASLTLNLQVST